MVDPLTQFFRASVSQNTLAGGLQQLLQSGSQRGTVQHGNDGKVFVNIKGFMLPLTTSLSGNQTAGSSTNQAPFPPGQAVIVKLQNGQITVEPLPPKTAPLPENTLEVPKTVSTLLSQLGINTPQAQTAAQALVQNNIPLNTSVIKELAQTFPQLNPETLQTLIFLISRRLPISDSMLYWFTRMSARRENTGKLTQAIIEDIDALQDQLTNHEDEFIRQIQKNMGGFQEQLQQQFLAFQQNASGGMEDELKQAFQNALISAEAILSSNISPNTSQNVTLAETIVKLLAYLIQIQPQMEHSPYLPQLQDLIHKVESLQESLASQSILNIPSEDGNDTQTIFIKIPILKDDGKDQLELLFKPSNANTKSGSVDMRVELSQLGAMQIHIGWQHPHITLGLMVEDESVKQFLDENQNELKNGLSQLGFHVFNLQVKQAEIPVTLQPKFHNPLHTTLSGVDVRI